jgi:hypothetical protein
VIFRQGTFSDETAIFWTLVLIGVAVVLAISQRILRQDTAYGMVIAWALYGLGVKQIQYVTNEAQLPPAPQLVMVASMTAISLASLLFAWWLLDRVRMLMHNAAAKTTA